LVGVGYRASNQGQKLDLALVFSQYCFKLLWSNFRNYKRKVKIVKLTSFDKQLLGQVAAKIRGFRKPEPYKGKGVKFVGEVLRKEKQVNQIRLCH
jgi:large subunit ribosomal protein L6